jgi:hypothetical protein
METKSFKNTELPSCAWVLNWSGVAIRNCTKVQLGTKKIIYPIPVVITKIKNPTLTL